MAESGRKSFFRLGIKRGILVSLVAGVTGYLLGVLLNLPGTNISVLQNLAPRNIIGPAYFIIVVGYALVRGNRAPLNSVKGLFGYWIGGVLIWLPVLLVLAAFRIL